MPTTADGAASPCGTSVGASVDFRGNDRLLLGIILGVLGFWLFAQTTLNIAPDMQNDLGLSAGFMNVAVALTALFSGIFIVVIGGLADRVGRVRVVMAGFVLSIIGSLLIGLAPGGAFAAYFLLPGRALQGLSGACIMPASLALVKAYWDGESRSAPSACGRSGPGADRASVRCSAASLRRISDGAGSSSHPWRSRCSAWR